MRSVIVGTAGHIDHGKTTLVRALTGVDADRLPEEKRRGITIDLGFAELDLGDVRVGFVDVPGHERFVKNMLAGAHGIDLVALVIAADEGVMPQTREHFDICRLLAIKSGLVIITKTGTVDEELLELGRAEAEEVVAGSVLEGGRVGAVSASAGQRTAVNLGGVESASVERGMVLAPVGRLRPTQVFDALVTVLADAPRPLRTRQRVRVHQGTAEVLARVAALEESGRIEPGATGLAQLRLESSIVALPGDHFIIRTYSPQQTMAGGEVLDAHAPKHKGRERAAAREKLAALVRADRAARLAFFVESAGERGLPRALAAARTGWRDEVLDAALAGSQRRGAGLEAEGGLFGDGGFRRLLWAAVEGGGADHGREPLSWGVAGGTRG